MHRLDRETSGVLVFAKTRGAATRLGRAFAEGHARKRYLARVAPVPRAETWEVSGFLGRVLDPQRYRFALRDAEAPGFRASHTRFARVRDDGATALVACVPTTGRSHQLRVHLAASGTPIVGDLLYGGAAGERTLLHASELSLPEAEGAPPLRRAGTGVASGLSPKRSRAGPSAPPAAAERREEFQFARRRPARAMPARPIPSITRVPGSGTMFVTSALMFTKWPSFACVRGNALPG